jgi:pyruvate/2-oxoglutarate dehydrogenase complex dihydrolipoamide acyltransferase (E2) component
VPVPQLGEMVPDRALTLWFKAPGDRVEVAEAICEVSPVKVDTEIPALFAGIGTGLLVPAGETVPVGTVLVTIDRPAGTTAARPAVTAHSATAPQRQPILQHCAGPTLTPPRAGFDNHAQVSLELALSGVIGQVTGAGIELATVLAVTAVRVPGRTGQVAVGYDVGDGKALRPEVVGLGSLRLYAAQHALEALRERARERVLSPAELFPADVAVVASTHQELRLATTAASLRPSPRRCTAASGALNSHRGCARVPPRVAFSSAALPPTAR